MADQQDRAAVSFDYFGDAVVVVPTAGDDRIVGVLLVYGLSDVAQTISVAIRKAAEAVGEDHEKPAIFWFGWRQEGGELRAKWRGRQISATGEHAHQYDSKSD